MITSQFSGSANTDYSALLNYDKTLTAPGKLYITTTDTNTSSISALVLNGNEVEKRTLGSAAFSNTGDYVNVTGDTMTGDLTMGANGIFIGGTATGNKLDDYEEGTFTPTLLTTGTDTNPITKQGRYTKIGNLVTVTIMVSVSLDENRTLSLSECSNLPFTIRNEASFAGILLRGVAEHNRSVSDAFEVYCEGVEGTLRLLFKKGNSSIAFQDDQDNLVMAQITYEVE